MYFDLEPKSARRDLYDFDAPFEKLLALPKGPRTKPLFCVVAGLKPTCAGSCVHELLFRMSNI